jgi:hypothetical protein
MEGNPVATVRRLYELRGMISEVVLAHGGRVFGIAGDSEMAAFDNELKALNAALEIRARTIEMNARVRKADRMLLRTGLGYGRVLSEGSDIFGDDVNIAARVMALAGANEIVTTEAFCRLVSDRTPCGFVGLGRHKLKNINHPVWVYKVILPAAVMPAIGAIAGRLARGGSTRLSLAAIATAGLIAAAFALPTADFGHWAYKAASLVGLERYIVSEKRTVALTIADGELFLAARQELDREIAARRVTEAKLAEALAKAEAEANARAETERLLRLAESRALSAEEKGFLAEQLALLAGLEAEAAVLASNAAAAERERAEQMTATALRVADEAEIARRAAEAEAASARVLAAQLEKEFDASKRQLVAREEAKQEQAERFSAIVQRVAGRRQRLVENTQPLAIELRAVPDDMPSGDLVSELEDDLAPRLPAWVTTSDTQTEHDVDAARQEARKPSAAIDASSENLPGKIANLQKAFISFTINNPPPNWPYRYGTFLNADLSLTKVKVIRSTPPHYVLAIDWSMNARAHGLFGGIEDRIAVRWTSDEVRVLRWDGSVEDIEDNAADWLDSTRATLQEKDWQLSDRQWADLKKKIRSYLLENWLQAGLPASWGQFESLGNYRVIGREGDLYDLELDLVQGWHGRQTVQLSLLVKEENVEIIRPVRKDEDFR